jgi:hypothetical protein
MQNKVTVDVLHCVELHIPLRIKLVKWGPKLHTCIEYVDHCCVRKSTYQKMFQLQVMIPNEHKFCGM